MLQFLAFLLLLIPRAHGQLLTPVSLRVDGSEEPLGVDVRTGVLRLSWQLAHSQDTNDVTQTSFTLRISEHLVPQPGPTWSVHLVSSRPACVLRASQLRKEEGQNSSLTNVESFHFAAGKRYRWSVRVFGSAGTVAGGWSSWHSFVTASVANPQWITAANASLASGVTTTQLVRDFSVSQGIASAVLTACGVGLHRLFVNGIRIGKGELEPAWTDYQKTCMSTTHDVTAQVNLSANAANRLGAWLGNGFYNVPKSDRYAKYIGVMGPRQVALWLSLTLLDGTTQVISSDTKWQVMTSPGPITFTTIYGGEDYDARLAQPWSSVPTSSSAAAAAVQWGQVVASSGPGCNSVEPTSVPPSTIISSLPYAAVSNPAEGVYVFDLGQNIAGFPKLVTRGTRGAVITMVPGETLVPDTGRVSQTSMGIGPDLTGSNRFTYTLAGDANDEVWQPMFSYHGMRYLEVTGAVPGNWPGSSNAAATVINLSGQWVHTASPHTGFFESSNPVYNSIHSLMLAAISSNLQTISTDCPHREKLGWLEESHHMLPSYAWNYDVRALMNKVTADMVTAQTSSGMVPDIAPEYTVFAGAFRDAPDWGSSIVLVPWHLYQIYGPLPDILSSLRHTFGAMVAFVQHLLSKTRVVGEHTILDYGLGDWCEPRGYFANGSWHNGGCNPVFTPLNVTSTAILYADATVLSSIARVLNMSKEAMEWAAKADSIKASFQALLYDAKQKCVVGDSQGGNAMALYWDLVPTADRSAVFDRIVTDVQQRDNHVTTGENTHRYVLQILQQFGRSDVISDLLASTTYPSFGFWLAQGASSALEYVARSLSLSLSHAFPLDLPLCQCRSWEADTALSWDHDMFGHIEEFFYSSVLGFSSQAEQHPLLAKMEQEDDHGMSFVSIAPSPRGVNASWASGSMTLPAGAARVRWDTHTTTAAAVATTLFNFSLFVEIPPSTVALVHVPLPRSIGVTPLSHTATSDPQRRVWCRFVEESQEVQCPPDSTAGSMDDSLQVCVRRALDSVQRTKAIRVVGLQLAASPHQSPSSSSSSSSSACDVITFLSFRVPAGSSQKFHWSAAKHAGAMGGGVWWPLSGVQQPAQS